MKTASPRGLLPSRAVADRHMATCTLNSSVSATNSTIMASNNSKSSNNKAPAVAAAPPLNVYKKVAVIRRPSDSLTYEDGEGNPKTVSIEELGDAIATAVRTRLAYA